VTQGVIASAAAPPLLAEWAAGGETVEAGGMELFVRREGAEGAPELLVLHGFPSSSRDFAPALPRLGARYRVCLHDHPGFGLSAKPVEYSYSLIEQAEAAIALWRRLGIERGHLLAHDYGTSVATELLARRERGALPLEIESLTLVNGSVHLDLARPTLSQKLMRHRRTGPFFVRAVGRAFFKSRIRRILGDRASVPESELEAMWAGVEHAAGRRLLPRISGYLDERVRFRRRWIGALERFDRPAHVLWGRRDPIAGPPVAEALAAEIPACRLTWLDDLGHYPMLEAPERWADAVLAGLAAMSR